MYASDIAKSINAPVIHVNGDDPEAVARATLLALEYRLKFKKDVVIDILGYRFWGHNELDEPSFTQPKMYSVIKSRPTIASKYFEVLKQSIGENVKKQIHDDYFAVLDEALRKAESFEPQTHKLQSNPTWDLKKEKTGVSVEQLKSIGVRSVTIPPDFVHIS